MTAKEDMGAEQEGKKTEQEASRAAVMVEMEGVASKKDIEFWKWEVSFRERL